MSSVKLTPATGKKLWSISALAEEFEIDRRTVKKKLLDIVPAGKLSGANAWHMKDAAGVLADIAIMPEDFADPSKLPPGVRDQHYSAELKRLTFEERERILIPETEYHADLSAALKLVVNTLENIPDILERDCNLSGETVERCIEVIDGLRDELAKDLCELEVDLGVDNG